MRLTAEDGYTAQRSYSVASAPDGSNEIDLTVERFPDGEISSFLHDVVAIGDELEVRGPIGGWFVWEGDTPALLVGGGSGIVPLMAMLRLARATGRTDLVRLVVSVRTFDDLYYASEVQGPETTVVYTRTAPDGAERPASRLAPADIAPLRAPRRDGLRVRIARIRRCRERAPRRARRPGRTHPRRTLRPHRLSRRVRKVVAWRAAALDK